jgi:hypothetical protein
MSSSNNKSNKSKTKYVIIKPKSKRTKKSKQVSKRSAKSTSSSHSASKKQEIESLVRTYLSKLEESTFKGLGTKEICKYLTKRDISKKTCDKNKDLIKSLYKNEKTTRKNIKLGMKLRSNNAPVTPKVWIQSTRKQFPEWVNNAFSKYQYKEEKVSKKPCGCSNTQPCFHFIDQPDKFELTRHQKFMRDYMQQTSPYRGILVYHGLGSGKTCSSIGVAESLKSKRDVVILLPASLRQTWISELRNCADDLYKEKKNWVKVPKTQTSRVKKLMEQYKISVKSVNKMKGIWEFDTNRKSNFDRLDKHDKNEIIGQINEIIQNKYTFIHYNGIFDRDFSKWGPSYFDNKLIIVDEVHNLMSQVYNKSKIGSKLYERIMTASGSRFVLLSGTPIINNPFEIAALFNLLRGQVKLHSFLVKNRSTGRIWGAEEMKRILSTCTHIDQIVCDVTKQTVLLTKNPPNFMNVFENGKKVGIKYMEDLNTDDIFISEVTYILRNAGYEVTKTSKLQELAFPDDVHKFNQYFIDQTASKPKLINKNLFKSRMLGTVSYYRGSGKEYYPEVLSDKIIEVPMSNYQLGVYIHARNIERNLDMKYSGMDENGDDNNKPTYYRTYSRGACNFVYPEDFPSRIPAENKGKGKDVKKIDIHQKSPSLKITKDGETTDTKLEGEIEDIKTTLIRLLRRKPNEYLTGTNLKRLSPKFAMITNNIVKSPGSALVYSQYREESIEILALVLEQHGFTRFKMRLNHKTNDWEEYVENEADRDKPKIAFYTGKESQDEKAMIKRIFNSDFSTFSPKLRKYFEAKDNGRGNLYGGIIKALLVTSSAAEGIDLRNTRQVHIVEPYWNPVRTEQVKGRAVRYKSHLNLPKKDRNVQIFTYVSSFTKKQIAENRALRAGEEEVELSSDQALLMISNRKSAINNSILDVVKQSSIDCKLHDPSKKDCVVYNYKSADEYSFLPNLESNKNLMGVGNKRETVKLQRFKYHGKTYGADKDKNVYDIDTMRHIGKIEGKRVIFSLF